MALKFLNLKSFHPSNKSNQKLLFIAEEEQKDRLRQEERNLKDFNEEQEIFKDKITREKEKQYSAQNNENFRKKLEKEKQNEESLALDPEFKATKKKRRS